MIYKNHPFFMESPGIKPGSKQATKEISTHLFADWIFDVKRGKKQPLKIYLLIFEIQPKLMEIQVYFYGSPILNAINKGFQGEFDFSDMRYYIQRKFA